MIPVQSVLDGRRNSQRGISGTGRDEILRQPHHAYTTVAMASLYQTDLPSHYRRLYRAQFADSLARGSAQPFVLPYAFVGATVLPVLYLSISHRKRPWLALLRFPVALTVLLFNTNLLLRGTSSASFAVAYAAGLVAAWGSIWGVGLLLFADVQTRVARVRLRRRVNRVGEIEDNKKGAVIVDESEAAVLKSGEWEHYWQGYPEEGTFWERLGWVWDLNMSPRGVGEFSIQGVVGVLASADRLRLEYCNPNGTSSPCTG